MAGDVTIDKFKILSNSGRDDFRIRRQKHTTDCLLEKSEVLNGILEDFVSTLEFPPNSENRE